MPPPRLLTADDVHEIRTQGLADSVQAARKGVSRATVYKARVGILYANHSTPPDIRPPADPGKPNHQTYFREALTRGQITAAMRWWNSIPAHGGRHGKVRAGGDAELPGPAGGDPGG